MPLINQNKIFIHISWSPVKDRVENAKRDKQYKSKKDLIFSIKIKEKKPWKF